MCAITMSSIEEYKKEPQLPVRQQRFLERVANVLRLLSIDLPRYFNREIRISV
jgi:hypothetical protein